MIEDLDAIEVDFWEQGGHVVKNFAIFGLHRAENAGGGLCPADRPPG